MCGVEVVNGVLVFIEVQIFDGFVDVVVQQYGGVGQDCVGVSLCSLFLFVECDVVLGLLGCMLVYLVFLQVGLECDCVLVIVNLKEELIKFEIIVEKVFMEVVYGSYFYVVDVSEVSLQVIICEDLLVFYCVYYVVNCVVIVLIGDIIEVQVCSIVSVFMCDLLQGSFLLVLLQVVVFKGVECCIVYLVL